MTDDLHAAAFIEESDLPPSESLAVVRIARDMPGALADNLPEACDQLANDHEDRALMLRIVAGRLQRDVTR